MCYSSTLNRLNSLIGRLRAAPLLHLYHLDDQGSGIDTMSSTTQQQRLADDDAVESSAALVADMEHLLTTDFLIIEMAAVVLEYAGQTNTCDHNGCGIVFIDATPQVICQTIKSIDVICSTIVCERHRVACWCLSRADSTSRCTGFVCEPCGTSTGRQLSCVTSGPLNTPDVHCDGCVRTCPACDKRSCLLRPLQSCRGCRKTINECASCVRSCPCCPAVFCTWLCFGQHHPRCDANRRQRATKRALDDCTDWLFRQKQVKR